MSDDHRFTQKLDLLEALHDKKQKDYGQEGDPLANVRGSEDFGVPGWVGALIRANDKMRRLQKAAKGGTLANESIVDSFMDLAVYAIIAWLLYEEEQGQIEESIKASLTPPMDDNYQCGCADPDCPWKVR